MIDAFFKSDLFEQPPRLRHPAAFEIEFVRQQHVFESRQCLDQLVGLKDKSNLASAHRCQLGLGKVMDWHSVQPDLTLAR